MDYYDRFWQLVAKRTVSLFGHIDGDRQGLITEAITLLNEQSQGPIKFLLDSEGGSANHALYIHDAIVYSASPVDGLIMGKAHSGALIISQAFRRRVAYPHATFLLHGPSLDGLRSDQNNLNDMLNFRKNLHEKMLIAIAQKTGQPMKLLRAWSKEERFFDTTEALRLNFIDEIAQPPK